MSYVPLEQEAVVNSYRLSKATTLGQLVPSLAHRPETFPGLLYAGLDILNRIESFRITPLSVLIASILLYPYCCIHTVVRLARTTRIHRIPLPRGSALGRARPLPRVV